MLIKVRKIVHWLYRNIESEYRMTIPSAVEILHEKRGDCNEHATLMAALCRSVGIPTKICSGLVFDGGKFYYHAWNEVLLKNDPPYWFPVDTVFGGLFVDATHIKLTEGDLDQQVGLTKLIGTLKVEVLAFE